MCRWAQLSCRDACWVGAIHDALRPEPPGQDVLCFRDALVIRVICACVPVSQVLHLLDNFVPAVTHAKHLAESAAGLRKAAEQQSVDIETHESGQCTCISCASVWRHRQGCRALYRSLLKQDALQAAPQAERGGRPAALSTGPLPALQSQNM